MKYKGFYVGCLRSGNIGDDILFDIFLKMLSEALYKRFNKEVKVHREIISEDAFIWRKTSSFGVLGGGTLIHGYDGNYTSDINGVQYSMIFGTGILSDIPLSIDNIEKIKENNYYDLLYNHKEVLKNNIRNTLNIKFGGFRGPLSIFIAKSLFKSYKKEYLYDAGILSDLFLAKEKSNISLLSDKKIVGINLVNVVGPQRLGIVDNEIISSYNERIFQVILDTCKSLLKTDKYKIVFFEMSSGGEKACSNRLYRKLIQDLPLYNKDIIFFKKAFNCYDVLKICSLCYATIGTRLHSNILSASLGIPFVSIAYSLKSVDFAKSIDLENLICPTCYLNVEDIIEKINYIEKNYEEIKNVIKIHKEKALLRYKEEINKLIAGIKISDSNCNHMELIYDNNHSFIGKLLIKVE